MTEREIIELAYNVRQKQKEYFKRYDRGVLAEAKHLKVYLTIQKSMFPAGSVVMFGYMHGMSR